MQFRSIYLFAFLSYTVSVFAGSTLPNTLAQLKSLVPDLLNADASTLTFGLKFGLWKSEDLVKAYTRRINEVNNQLHAVLEINPDAIQIAKALDQERKNGNVRSPLHGLPILIKDQIASKDKLNNSAGSFAFDGSKISEDSFLVQKLRNAGVVILGKNSMSEFAGLRSVTPQEVSGGYPQGWCAKGGQGFSAYAQNLLPGGSSSGPAVAASVGLAFAALGTCTGGSIPIPAGRNNVVGIRPTVGLTSRFGVIPLSKNRDTIGPMARTVSDAAAVLSVIAGKDPRDPLTLQQPFATPPNYMNALNKNALQGKRIGVPRNANLQFDPNFDGPQQAAFENAIKVIESLGATVVNTSFTSIDDVVADLFDPASVQNFLTAADFAAELQDYIALLETNPNGVTDIVSLRDFIQGFARENYPTFDTSGFDAIVDAIEDGTLPVPGDAVYNQLDSIRIAWGTEGGLPGAMQRDNLDAIILPSEVASASPSLIGLPGISIPMGSFPNDSEVRDLLIDANPDYTVRDFGPNLPIGLSFFGAAWSEESLIGYAYAFEQKTKFRTKVNPVIKPTTQLWNVVFGV